MRSRCKHRCKITHYLRGQAPTCALPPSLATLSSRGRPTLSVVLHSDNQRLLGSCWALLTANQQ